MEMEVRVFAENLLASSSAKGLTVDECLEKLKVAGGEIPLIRFDHPA
jgi:hypothetical protein